MKKQSLIGIIAVVVIVVGGGIYFMSNKTTKNTSVQATTTSNVSNTTASTVNTSNNNTNTKATFSKQEQDNYYKLSQNAGDIGTPSASMTTNLNQGKTINGNTYYKVYNYDTRAAYGDDTSSVTDGNYSHFVGSKIISLDGNSIPSSEFGTISSSNVSNADLESQLAKITALYVEGYTANNPKLQTSANDNYESNLNEVPAISVNLNNTKNMNNETLYEVNVTINNKVISIYVGLDGYIYISSPNSFNELFFPNQTA